MREMRFDIPAVNPNKSVWYEGNRLLHQRHTKSLYHTIFEGCLPVLESTIGMRHEA